MNVVKSIDRLRSAVGISGRTMGACVGAGAASSAMGALRGMIRLAVRGCAAAEVNAQTQWVRLAAPLRLQVSSS